MLPISANVFSDNSGFSSKKGLSVALLSLEALNVVQAWAVLTASIFIIPTP